MEWHHSSLPERTAHAQPTFSFCALDSPAPISSQALTRFFLEDHDDRRRKARHIKRRKAQAMTMQQRAIRTQDEHDEMMTAIHEGRASELMRCPVDGSLQGITKITHQPAHFFDPSTIYTLRCGHKVI